MGASKSQSTSTDPTLHAEQFDQLNNCGMYRNSEGKQYEKYRVQNYGFNDFVSKYQYRIRNQSQYLVNAYFIGEIGNTFGCSVTDLYDVVIERVQYRLADLINLDWYESVDVLCGALKGFAELYAKVGLFLIKDTMIGMDKYDQVKVWLNPKFQLNSLETQPISFSSLPEEQRQSAMVDNIFQLVLIRSKSSDMWLKFVKEWKKIKPSSFNLAIQFVQNFIQSHQKISAAKNQQSNMQNTSNCTLSNTANLHQYQTRNKTKQTQSQTQTQSQSQSLLQYQPNQLLTKSIDLKAAQNSIENNPRTPIVHVDGKMQGFASLRNRAIQNMPVNNRNNPPIHHQQIFNISGMPTMPAMPAILQSRHQRTNNQIKNILPPNFKLQAPPNNLSHSCQILPLMRRQPPITNTQPTRSNPIFIPQLNPKIAEKVNQNHVRSFSQQMKFPEPRHAVQIIKPNKSTSRLSLDKKQIVNKEVVRTQLNVQQQKQILPVFKTQPQLPSEQVINNNSQLANSEVKLIPKQKEVIVGEVSQSRRLRRQPGKIKSNNQKLVESRSRLNYQNNPETTLVSENVETNIKYVNNKIQTNRAIVKQIKASQEPELVIQKIEKPVQTLKQESKPQQIHDSATVQKITNQPQKLERSLSAGLKMIENMQKKMQMSRVSRLSRTNSEVNNSISYSDLRSLLKSVHRRSNN